MQRHYPTSRSTRSLRLALLASICLFPPEIPAWGDEPIVEIEAAPIPAERTGDDMELLPPANSTLEIRVARRPWLLERLSKPAQAPSVKMNPPKPPPQPIAVPPSAGGTGQTYQPDSWVPRGSAPVPQDVVKEQAETNWFGRGSVDPRVPIAGSNDYPTSRGEAKSTVDRFERGKHSGPTALQKVGSGEFVERSLLPVKQSPNSADQVRETRPLLPRQTDMRGLTVVPLTPTNDPPVDDIENAFEAARQAAPATIEPKTQQRPDIQQRPAEQPLAEQPLAEQPWAEQPWAGAPAMTKPSAEQDPVDQPEPSDSPVKQAEPYEPPAAEGIAEAEPTEDQPADHESFEAAPSDDVPAAGVPSDGVRMEEQPTDEAPASSEDPSVSGEDTQAAEQEVTIRKLRINRDGTPTGTSARSGVLEGADRSRSSSSSIDRRAAESVLEPRDSDRTSDSGVKGELDYTGHPRIPIQLNSTVTRMRQTLASCLRYYYARPENANERSNWGMLHSIMVFGADTKILAGQNSYSAIGWIAGNNACRGQRLIELKDGHLSAKNGVGLQGHQAQFLAILALCDVPIDYPLYAGSKRFSVRDLVAEEMLACRTNEELTFTLIGLSHYLDTDTEWQNESGETWSISRLIREELSQPIVGAACGGTHRLMGFAHALRKRRSEGRSLIGQWERADIYCQDFISYVYRLQNRDGSMSTDWFEGREDNRDLDRKIQTTGHMVEWLLSVVPDSELQDRRLVSAVRFLLNSMYNGRSRDWQIGPKGHALRSLAMYYERVYQEGPAWQTSVATRGRSGGRR